MLIVYEKSRKLIIVKDIPVAPAEALELVEQLVRRACSLPPEDNPLVVDKLDIADYIFQLCQFNPPENITLPPGYTAPALAITGLYWRGWALLLMLAAHNPATFAARAAAAYPTLARPIPSGHFGQLPRAPRSIGGPLRSNTKSLVPVKSPKGSHRDPIIPICSGPPIGQRRH
ncbi:hypothetical protein evm_010704 [Chilo suppressalis]|nr:hypothetical protein evm_010704 [Chilo suppressalis]